MSDAEPPQFGFMLRKPVDRIAPIHRETLAWTGEHRQITARTP
jgi:hypothetical protein